MGVPLPVDDHQSRLRGLERESLGADDLNMARRTYLATKLFLSFWR